jgi:predicted nucleotidyltransferase
MSDPSTDTIPELLRTHPSVEAAWVFGSVASGAAGASSDLDVGVLGTAPLAAEEKKALIEQLAQATGRPVDLVDLQSARGPIVGRILQEGTRLFCDNTTLYAKLLTRWWGDRADWQPYRRRILKERRDRWIENS